MPTAMPDHAGLTWGCRRAREGEVRPSGTVVLGKWKQDWGPGSEGWAKTDALIRGSWGV